MRVLPQFLSSTVNFTTHSLPFTIEGEGERGGRWRERAVQNKSKKFKIYCCPLKPAV
jgi:hypothetical protein